jgi:ribosomal protein S18 acetylase RimI-like enzyme
VGVNFTEIQTELPDHEVRAVTFDDVPALIDLLVRLTTVVLGEPDVTESEVRDDLVGPHFDLATDTFIALDQIGRATAYGQGYDEHSGSAWIDVYLDPALDDEAFRLVADAAVAACQERIVESVTSRGASSIHVTANLYENETRMRAAYERAGLAVETVYWRMQAPLNSDAPLEAPVVPNGVRLTKVDPRDNAVMSVAYELFHDTFSEHHGIEGSEKSLSDYTEYVRTAESFDPESWWFAYDGDDPIGLLIGDNRRAEAGVGYVRSVGVRKQHRGRGVARALLLSAFADYRDRGRTSVQLGVDTGNTTGATRLYESVGMTSLNTAIALGREITL